MPPTGHKVVLKQKELGFLSLFLACPLFCFILEREGFSMKTSLKVIACMAALAVLVTVQSAAAQGKIEGVWKGTEITFTGAKPQTVTLTQPGLLIFTKKHFSFLGITGDKPRPDLPQKDATDAQKVAAWGPFMAVAGTLEVKGATVTLKAIVAKDPSGMAPGNFMTADFKVEGNTLILTLKSRQAGPTPNPMTIKLVRLEQ
jgi:hypothetical protein